MIIALLVVATIGLAGGGPWWFRYIGSGMLFLMLLLILTQTSNLPDKEEYRRMFSGGEGEEIYSAEPMAMSQESNEEDILGSN